MLDERAGVSGGSDNTCALTSWFEQAQAPAAELRAAEMIRDATLDRIDAVTWPGTDAARRDRYEVPVPAIAIAGQTPVTMGPHVDPAPAAVQGVTGQVRSARGAVTVQQRFQNLMPGVRRDEAERDRLRRRPGRSRRLHRDPVPQHGLAELMVTGNRRVVQPGRGGGWEVLRPGAHRAVAVLCSRDEAVTRARALLHLDGGGGIHVFGCDGRLVAVEQVDTTA